MTNRHDLYKTTGDPRYLAGTFRVPEAEVDSLIAPGVFSRLTVYLPPTAAPEAFSTNLRRALFDTDGHWSHLRVVALWPDMTIWPCSLSAKVLAEMLDSPPQKGEARRRVEMVRLKNANHVVSLDRVSKNTIIDGSCRYSIISKSLRILLAC